MNTKQMLIFRNVAFLKHNNTDGTGYIERYIVPEETNRALQEALRTGKFKERCLKFLTPGPNQREGDPSAALLKPRNDETPIKIDEDGNITKDGVRYGRAEGWGRGQPMNIGSTMNEISKIRPGVVTDEEAEAENAAFVKKIRSTLENMESFVLIGQDKGGKISSYWYVDGPSQLTLLLTILQARVFRTIAEGDENS